MGRKLCTKILQEEVRMSFLDFFGAADRNAEKRTAEYGDWKRYLEQYDANEKVRKEKHESDKIDFELAIADQEDNLRRTEKDLIQQYETQVEIQNFRENEAKRAYDKSAVQAATQKEFNKIAEVAALSEQDAKRSDDLLAVMFDERDTLLEHSYATTGLKVDKYNKLAEVSFSKASNQVKFTGDVGQYELERRKARSESLVETQKAIIDGMKAAGAVRARGGTGRSSEKGALAVMAESGALRASISNGLMYAEQGIDLNIAQLKDMLILDQTMVMAARYAAEDDFTLKSSKLNATLRADKMKIAASRSSIKERDRIVRENILNARTQADLNAEAQVLLEPSALPALTDPREFYKEYDDPETEDYLEIFKRPRIQEFPEYEQLPRLDFERDFHYSRGRENVASSNFGDALKIGGMVATGVSGVGALASGGLFGGAAAGSALSQTGFLATGMKTFGTIGTGLTQLSNSFYPQQSR